MSLSVGLMLDAPNCMTIYNLEDASMILELFQNMHSLYLLADNAGKRKILNLVLWNPRVQDGKVEYELRKTLATLADGVEEEEKLLAQNALLEERNKNRLPKCNPLHKHSLF